MLAKNKRTRYALVTQHALTMSVMLVIENDFHHGENWL